MAAAGQAPGAYMSSGVIRLVCLVVPWLPMAAAGRVASHRAPVWHTGALLATEASGASNASGMECFKGVTGHPSEIQCPLACPFLRAEPTHMCLFKCVPPDHCFDDDPLSSFANPETMRCEGCHAVACLQCRTAWKCAKCQDGFVLSRFGACRSPYRSLWWVTYMLILVIVLPVLYYLVMLPFRPAVNQAVLDKALHLRENGKMHDEAVGLPFKLWKNLGREYVAGIGILLHFRWQQMVIVWSFFVFVLLLVLSFCFNTRPSAVKHSPGAPKAFAACEHGVLQQEGEFVVMEKVYFFSAVGVYLVSTAGSLFFAVQQRRTAHLTSDEIISMADYGALVRGLPVQSGDGDPEGELKKFFQQQFSDLKIIGISICWNLNSSSMSWVDEQIEREISELDAAVDGDRGRLSRIESESSEQETKRCIQPGLRCFDAIFGIGPNLLGPEKVDETPAEVEAKLRALETSGTAIVVFDTEFQCQEALRRSRQSALVYGETNGVANELYMWQQGSIEPRMLIWGGFGTSLLKLVRNLVIGNLVIFFAVIVLDIFFYAPYVVYVFMYSDVKGMVGGAMVQGTLLGLLIVVCNQVIYNLIGIIAERCGFKFRSMLRMFYVVQYTFAVFFNTCVDLWTVMLLAQGFSVQDVTKKMGNPVGGDGALSLKAIAEQPSVQRSVYTQLMLYLYPGCLLIPFLLEPLIANLLFLLLPTWLVRSRKEVKINEAEQLLAAPEFDLARYGDIVVNVMLCVLCLAFTYRDLYQVFAWLTISLIIIYCWDHCRLLRCSKQSSYSSPLMNTAAHWLLAVPCAMLAGVLVFHVWAASDDGFLEPAAEFWQKNLQHLVLDEMTRSYLRLARSTIVWYMLMAFAGHLLFHAAMLTWIVPELSKVHQEHDDAVPYARTAATTPCTWFNANPVHCLRSKYIFKHSPYSIPSLPGKDYLLKSNPSLGEYFEIRETPRVVQRKASMPFWDGV